jgi:hypothetical protein
MCFSPFFPRILIHLIGLDHAIDQRRAPQARLGVALQLVSQFQQMPATAFELPGQLRRARALRHAAQDQHPFTTRAMRLLQQRSGEGVEDAPASTASIIQHRIARATMHAKSLAFLARRTTQAVRMQGSNQTLVTRSLVHEISNCKIHDRSSVSSRLLHYNPANVSAVKTPLAGHEPSVEG